ncbi:ATP-binding protein [Enterobacteriaceae bacterium H4N4]|uniref:ATP-binding protein n=1 Tax=Silvania confinis TaxID=2926470 RepID=A0A9J6QIF1_9ENTR|nr:ATP-binding protein [Silvania confinis]MCU6669142.1 ATP-binding protein [Silvania confinis]
MDSYMYLSSFSLVEPDETLHLYYPGWLNVWESHAYNNALKVTGANGWGFKRFGTMKDTYIREAVRRPNYMPYIDAMEKATDSALYDLSAKERMHLLKSRTAFIYVDSWGESSAFEYNISSLHAAIIDTLPKNLVKKFSVNDVTCKIRGEKNALMQAMRIAQDYLCWDVFDFVVICAGYRAVPILAFTAEEINHKQQRKKYNKNHCINVSIERAGCFIFSQRESKLKINCGSYIKADNDNPIESNKLIASEPNLISSAGGTENLPITSNPYGRMLDLIKIYGNSGCLTPALSWQYIAHHSLCDGVMRTILGDGFGGYNYFDTWY